MGGMRDRNEAVAACHDEKVANAAKAAGFKDIFYAKKGDSNSLMKTVLQAIDFSKTVEKSSSKK